MPEGTRLQADGLCSDGKLLWVLDAEQKKLRGVRVEEEEGKLRLSLDPEKSLDLPCENPVAVTFADGKFYVLDTAEKKIFAMDAKGRKKRGFPAPSETVADIAYDGEYFWAVDEKRKAAYMFEEHGVVILYLPLQFVPSGIACGGKLLWISAAAQGAVEEKSLYRFRLNEKQKYTLGDWLEADMRFSVAGGGTCHIALPENSNRQKMLTRITLGRAAQVVEDNWRQKAARFSGGGEVTVRARLHKIRYNIVPEQVGKFSKIPKKLRKMYTVDGDRLKLASVQVQAAKQDIKQLLKKWEKKRTPYWVARCAYEYLIQRVHYERVPGWVDAPTILERGKGTSSPISFAYVAICRALGVPARFSAGTRYRGKDPSEDREFHRWCEVYLPNYGWVAVDPSATGKNPSPSAAISHWGTVPNTDLVMTRGGGGSDIFGWSYNAAGDSKVANWSNIKRQGQ